MATITIRNLDDELKARLRLKAANQGHSMEEEARLILRRALVSSSENRRLGSRIRSRFGDGGGVELSLPKRDEKARSVDFKK